MDDIQKGLNSALDRVKLAEKKLKEEPESAHWHRVWRDASDLAVKWQRELRRGQEDESSTLEDELDALLQK